MAGNHLEYLAEHHPEGFDERLLLRAFEQGPRPDPNPPDLEDPIGQPLSVYRGQAEIIRTCVDHLVVYLKQR